MAGAAVTQPFHLTEYVSNRCINTKSKVSMSWPQHFTVELMTSICSVVSQPTLGAFSSKLNQGQPC